jgi:hypothetical protein
VKLEAEAIGLLDRCIGSAAATFHHELNTPTACHAQEDERVSWSPAFLATFSRV